MSGTTGALGESADTLHTSDRGEIEAIIADLVSQARHHVALAAPRLDHPIFLSDELSDALSHLAAAHPRNTVRILVEDDEFFANKNTRLLTLCRRFSTYVKARRIPEHHLPFTQLVLVVDDVGFAHQPSVDKPHVTACFNDRGRCRALLHSYDEMWDRGAPIPEISTLGL